MVSRVLALGLRGFEFFCVLIALALSGNQIAMGHAPAVINYDLFASVFAMFTLFYLIAATLNDGFVIHRAAMLAVDVLNLIFLFCAATATAAILGAHSCSNGAYLVSNKITMGSGHRCREAQASTAFLYFAFFAWIASTAFTALESRGGLNMRGPRSGASMSQV